jgi:tetratricopeptide (TPR) repeat protein
MTTESLNKCKYCNAEVTTTMIFGSTLICASCGQAELRSPKSSPVLKIGSLFAVVVILIVAIFYFQADLRILFDRDSALKSMTEAQVLELNNKCLRGNDRGCLIATYRRLVEIDPPSVSYRANLAFQLTQAHQYKEAQPIYDQILRNGTGTYDLMAFCAINLQGLGDQATAIKWFEKSLKINSALLDVTKELATAYVKIGRPAQAVTLLKSFIAKFPNSEGELSGDLSADMELLQSANSSQDKPSI